MKQLKAIHDLFLFEDDLFRNEAEIFRNKACTGIGQNNITKKFLGRFYSYILLVAYYLYYTSILSTYLGTLAVWVY